MLIVLDFANIDIYGYLLTNYLNTGKLILKTNEHNNIRPWL